VNDRFIKSFTFIHKYTTIKLLKIYYCKKINELKSCYEIIKIAKHTLEKEASSIKGQLNFINDDFIYTIQHILGNTINLLFFLKMKMR
jgi:hypothetical protein